MTVPQFNIVCCIFPGLDWKMPTAGKTFNLIIYTCKKNNPNIVLMRFYFVFAGTWIWDSLALSLTVASEWDLSDFYSVYLE